MAGLNCGTKWETRLCAVNGALGYFHCWEHWSNVLHENTLRGCPPGVRIGSFDGVVAVTAGSRGVNTMLL